MAKNYPLGQDKYYGQGDKGQKKGSDLVQMGKQPQKPMQKLTKRESDDAIKKSKSVRKQKVIEEKVIYWREAEFME